MKTILYNPIFINPQAYYVFPQLYDIEKGDSFIEPAVYSGYLIIEDLISNTSSQVINTKEVDFTEFAGKRIRISQYTNIGAVVLGEWLLPEGEQSGPSFHQSLVDAWFMSGPSNSDKPSSITGVNGNEIILKNFAYALSSGFGKYEVDFNLFTYNKNRGELYRTSNTVVIKNSTIAKFSLIYTNTSNSSFKIKVTNVSKEHVLWIDGLQMRISEDGIYTIPVPSNGYLGFGTETILDSCNIIITQLPSAYEGALVFDGVDDIAYIENFDTLIGEEKIYTVIGNYTNISTKLSLFFNLYNRHNTSAAHSFVRVSSNNPVSIDINYTRAYTVNFETGKILYRDLFNAESVTSNFPTNIIPDVFSLNGFPNSKGLSNWAELSQVAYYYLGVYRGILTPEEIETEKERLNEEWLKRKTK